MLQQVKETTIGSLLTSKLVVVAAVAAVAMVLGAMSVGANWLAQKKLAELVEQQGAQYTPSSKAQSPRHSPDGPSSAAARAATGTAAKASRKKSSVAMAPAAAPAQNAASPPSGVGLPPKLTPETGPAQSIVPPLLPSLTPPSSPVPGSAAPGVTVQPLKPLAQLLSPITTVLPLEAQIRTPVVDIKLGL